MRFWAREARVGELLVDEAVSRISGITAVEAFLPYASKVALAVSWKVSCPMTRPTARLWPAGKTWRRASGALETMAGVAEGATLRFPFFVACHPT